MRILITNDDGVHAEGIFALKQALDSLGEVFVVAPDRQRSACGHSITLHKPLRITPVKLPDDSVAYASNGTPADCVTLGFWALMDGECDVVVSGINAGSNLGWDLTYSGTVSAAIEGAIIGLRSFAISVCADNEDEAFRYDGAATAARTLVERISTHEMPKHTLLNVNSPNRGPDELRGMRVTRQGSRRYSERLLPRDDPWGNKYYWLGGSIIPESPLPGTDVEVVQNGYVSVTPIHLDLTAHALIEQVEDWLK